MPIIEYAGSSRPTTWWTYISLQILRYGAAVAGVGLIICGIYAGHRDRPSLQWPGASGTVEHCEEAVYHGMHSNSHSVDITYAYNVSGRRYEGHTIALWSEDWGGRGTSEFVAAHPVHSAVEVFYDPEHPENAVLVRGPDELGNRLSIWGGCVALAGGIWWIWTTRDKAAEVKAKMKAGI